MREKLGAGQVVVWRWRTPPGAFISFVDERMAQSLAGQRCVTGTDGTWWVDSLTDNLHLLLVGRGSVVVQLLTTLSAWVGPLKKTLTFVGGGEWEGGRGSSM